MRDRDINLAITRHRYPNARVCELNAISYTTDLNAMHAAEKALDDAQWEEYATRICYPKEWKSMRASDCGVKSLCHATARQRAEAFLRTLGKWEDKS